MKYLHWNEIAIADFSEKNVSDMYSRGYVFTRKARGVMHQTRSVRIELAKFELSSENRRILKKSDGLEMDAVTLPLREGYDWSIGKLAKDFYEKKFGPGIMSAAKVKEMLTDPAAGNFNLLLRYIFFDITSVRDMVAALATVASDTSSARTSTGFVICYQNPDLLHYSYPFYDLKAAPKDMGLAMMIRAIEYTKSSALKYIYLGSLQRPGDAYKLQFAGLEWFDGGPGGTGKWQMDLEAAKAILKQQSAS